MQEFRASIEDSSVGEDGAPVRLACGGALESR